MFERNPPSRPARLAMRTPPVLPPQLPPAVAPDITPAPAKRLAQLAYRLPAAGERRAADRHPCTLDSSCAPITTAAGATWPAQVRDISLNGITLVLDRRFEPGTLLNVDLHSSEDDNELTLLARVVHVLRHSEGDWQHGCLFGKKLGDEELALLLL